MQRKIIWAVLLMAVGFLWISCADDEAVYKIGDQFVKQESKIYFVDTLTINASSIYVDSFQTSGYNKVFVGFNYDELGTTSVETYVEFSPSNDLPTLDETMQFDSLVLFVTQTGTYSGDTLLPKTYAVYEVKEPFEPRNNNTVYYNKDTLLTADETIGQFTTTDSPKKVTETNCRLSDDLGQKLYQWMLTDSLFTGTDTLLFNSENFLEQFCGIVIKPVTKSVSWSNNFYGVGTQTSSGTTTSSTPQIEIRMYYRLKNALENTYYAFTPTSTSNLFSHFKVDYSGSVVEGINTSGVLASEFTNNQVFVQAGGKIGFRVDIPLITRLTDIHPNFSVIDANLIIKPVKGTYNKTSELPTLSVYWIDTKNKPSSQLMDISGNNAVTSVLNVDEIDIDNTYYSFNILNFVLYKMKHGEFSDESLYFTLSDEQAATTLERVVFEDQSVSNSLKLQMHYVVY